MTDNDTATPPLIGSGKRDTITTMLIIPDGFVNLIWRFKRVGDADPMTVALGIGVTGDVDPDALKATWTEGAIADNTGSQVQLDSISIESSEGSIGEIPVNVNGGSGDMDLPQNCALLVKKISDSPGRKNRGRYYYPSVTKTTTDEDGVLGSGTLGDYQAAHSAWLADINALDGVESVVIFHTDATAPTVVTSFKVEAMIATQRRRLR